MRIEAAATGAPVPPVEFEIATERLTLRAWRWSDADDFAEMNADVEVMADLGGPLSRERSARKLERFRTSFLVDGTTRWVVTDHDGQFLGYCGIVRHAEDHALGERHDIGWRLIRTAWGRGCATEAATAALTDAFERLGLSQVLAYTAADNVRSRAVMDRLGLQRRAELDFAGQYDGVGSWSGLVWSAAPPGPSGR